MDDVTGRTSIDGNPRGLVPLQSQKQAAENLLRGYAQHDLGAR